MAFGRLRAISLAGFVLSALVRATPPSLDVPLAFAAAAPAFRTYLGGTGNERLGGVGVDALGNVYVVGSTASSDFPTVPPVSFPPPVPNFPVTFLSKLDPTGSTLLRSTVLSDFAAFMQSAVNAIAVDGAGNVYLTGISEGGLPVVNAAQPVYGGGGDAFVAKFDATGTLSFSTYLGGGARDSGTDIAVDAAGRVHVVGETASDSFPVQNASQPTSGGSWDVFVVQLDGSGVVQYATYLGGERIEERPAVATDASGHTWITGRTDSALLPTTSGSWRPASVPGPFVRSSDGGGSWTPSTSPLREKDVTAVTVDPTDAETVYAGTGRGTIYRSLDGGDTWSLLYSHSSPALDVLSLSVDPAHPATVYAALGTSPDSGAGTPTGTVVRTGNGGVDWMVANVGLGTASALTLATDPADSRTVYAATSGPSGLFRSDDGADHWTAVVLPDSLSGLDVVGAFDPPELTTFLAIDPGDPDHLVLAAAQRVGQSFDRGQTWTVSSDVFGECRVSARAKVCTMITALALDPTDARVIYVAGSFGFAKTTDGGQHWDRAFSCLKGTSALVVDPQHPATLYGVGYFDFAPHDLVRSTDGGASWTRLFGGFPAAGQPFALVPGPSPRLYGGLTTAGAYEQFVARLDLAGMPVFATYGGLSGASLDVDAAGNVFLPALSLDATGMPRPFSAPGHFDPAAVTALEVDDAGHVHGLEIRDRSAVVTEFDPADPGASVCSSLVRVALPARLPHDPASGLALNAAGDAFVGITSDATEPATPGAYQATNAGGTDTFVATIAAGEGGVNCPSATTTTSLASSCSPPPATTTTTIPAVCGDDLAGALCRLEDLLEGSLCGDDPVGADLRRFIARKLVRTRARLERAQASAGRKRSRALRRSRRPLLAIHNRTGREARKHKVSDACRESIQGRIGTLRQAIAAIE